MSPLVIFGITLALMLSGSMLFLSVNVLRKVARLQDRLDADMKALRGEITAVGRGAVGLAKRVKLVQESLQDTQRRQEDLEYKDVGDVAINHASKMVQMGAATEELVATCGLSKAEATLLSLMHTRAKASNRDAA